VKTVHEKIKINLFTFLLDLHWKLSLSISHLHQTLLSCSWWSGSSIMNRPWSFDIQILIAPLVSSNSSDNTKYNFFLFIYKIQITVNKKSYCKYIYMLQICLHFCWICIESFLFLYHTYINNFFTNDWNFYFLLIYTVNTGNSVLKWLFNSTSNNIDMHQTGRCIKLLSSIV
jgi:hypothetical protein